MLKLMQRLVLRPMQTLLVVTRGFPPVTSHESHLTNRESRITNHVSLDFPHYTRPASFRGWEVPEVLMNGNHESIRQWRRGQALAKTIRNRPDLLTAAATSLGSS